MLSLEHRLGALEKGRPAAVFKNQKYIPIKEALIY